MLEHLRTLLPVKTIILIFLLLVSAALLPADDALSLPQNLSAPIYIVSDARTGTILAERESDQAIAPASLTKLMTLHLSLQDVESGKLSYYRTYPIPPEGYAESMRPGSSVLGLTEGDEVTLLTLQRAAAIPSANDAAWSLAVLSAGTPGSFISRMNNEAARIGMSDTRYVDPDGWSERSTTSASDQLRLASYYIESHPEVLEDLHALPEMPYMNADKLSRRPGKKNTNLLIGRVEGVDGLKTGTIPSAGFHFLATAKRGSSRFFVLVMGIEADNFVEGLNRRAEEAQLLIEWAFTNYYTWEAVKIDPIEVRVRHGERQTVSLDLSESIEPLTLPLDGYPIIRVLDFPDELIAPVIPGKEYGRVRWYRNGAFLMERSLAATEEIGRRWKLTDVFR